METKKLSLLLPAPMYDSLESLVESGIFSSKTDIIREAIRRLTLEYNKTLALKEVARQYSSLKTKKSNPSAVEEEKLFGKFLKEKGLL